MGNEETSNFRRWTGIALYLSLDRPTIQFAVCDISSGMSKPLRIHLYRLRRLVRYLIKFPTESWIYELQECPREITVYTDSDWATDKATRKSMSSYSEFFGRHLIETSCARQSVVALSSRKAEYYALTRGVAAGLMSQQVWEVMNFKLPLVARTDSSAGKGIASRVGMGKVKHLSLRELWLQDVVQQGRVVIRKEPAKTNVADLGTKALTGARTTELVRMMPLSRRGVMAAILMACLDVASAQPQGDEEDWDVKTFWIYLIIMHILAIMGIMQMVRKLGALFNRAQTAAPVVSQAEDQEKVPDKQVADSPASVAGPAGSPATQGPIVAKAGSSAGSMSMTGTVYGGASSSSEGPRLRGQSEPSEDAHRTETATHVATTQRGQAQDYVYTTSKGRRFHNLNCGDLRNSRRMNPQGITRRSRPEAIRLGYRVCGNCGG